MFTLNWKKLRKRITRILFQMIITFLLLEVSLFFLVKLGFLNMITPTYNLPEYGYFSPVRSNLFGYQHQPNSTYKINKSCFTTEYSFNSLGFRDNEHAKSSNRPRVMVIGDSFMEGLGVSEDQRLSSLLEKETNIEHLNFAMSNKGTCQEFIIYDSIASKFQHDVVLWSIFPQNDLSDDDPTVKDEDNIAPCWSGNYPNYELTFFPKQAPQIKRKSFLKRFLKNYTYSYNALFLLKESLKKQKDYKPIGYFDYSKSQLDRVKYSILKLKEAAKNKKIVIICIPSHLELAYSYDPKNQQTIENELMEFCSQLDIEFIGLYPYFKQSKSTVEDLYLECDSHWNPFGHKKTMEILLKESETYKELFER